VRLRNRWDAIDICAELRRQDPYGFGVMPIDKGLAPCGSIHNRPHATGTFNAPPMQFARRLHPNGGALHPS
jgi:hypothetical protein